MSVWTIIFVTLMQHARIKLVPMNASVRLVLSGMDLTVQVSPSKIQVMHKPNFATFAMRLNLQTLFFAEFAVKISYTKYIYKIRYGIQRKPEFLCFKKVFEVFFKV